MGAPLRWWLGWWLGIADTQEECISKLKAWKAGMESKGLRVNIKKTKFLVSGEGHDVLQKSGMYPRAVCLSGVGSNSIQCTQCMQWVHKTGIKKKLVADPNYICRRCKGESRPVDGCTVTEVDVDGTMLDVEATFCYMLCSGGGCDNAIVARCCVAWGKFRKLLPVLTTRHLSPRICGKVYEACICSAMLHGRKTLGLKHTELQRLRRNDRAMIRWICGVKNRDETPSVSLLQKFGIQDITSVLRSRRLRWYGHVQLATSCVKSITNFTLPGTGRKGGQRKAWSRCVKDDINTCGLTGVDPLDRDAWKTGVRHSLVLPTPLNGTQTAP